MANLEDLILRDIAGNRPAAGIAGRLFYDTTNEKWERDTGATWEDCEPAAGGAGIPKDGWVADANTWSYSSADAPTFVISINADVTGLLQPGMRIKLTQTSAKYFIVTAVGSFSGGATLVTVYGGTDYTLANAAISDPYYSPIKAPFGFPMDPAKWTVSITNGSIQQMNSNSPAQGTWYNSISLSIPIGVWEVYYSIEFQFGKASTGIDCKTTLSTANNSESNNDNTTYHYNFSSAGIIQHFSKIIPLTLAAKATYYLNHLTTIASLNVFQTRGDVSPSKIIAICAYL